MLFFVSTFPNAKSNCKTNRYIRGIIFQMLNPILKTNGFILSHFKNGSAFIGQLYFITLSFHISLKLVKLSCTVKTLSIGTDNYEQTVQT